MLSYPFELDKDGDTYLVTFPDIPEAAAVVELADVENAAYLSLDGLLCALDMYVADRRPIPLPSTPNIVENVVTLPALEAAKVLVSNEMVKQGVRKAEMARRLEVTNVQVNRLLDLQHNTQIAFLEKAADKLGKHLNISLS